MCVDVVWVPGGPPVFWLAHAVILNNFLQQGEVMLPEHKLILSSASVASALRRPKDYICHRATVNSDIV